MSGFSVVKFQHAQTQHYSDEMWHIYVKLVWCFFLNMTLHWPFVCISVCFSETSFSLHAGFSGLCSVCWER